MTTLDTAHRSAIQLTGVAQAAAQVFENAMPLTPWLPPRRNPTLTYSFNASGLQPIDVAEYRAFDTPAPYGQLGQRITKEGHLPPISRKLPISEYQELQWANRLDQLGDLMDEYAARLGVAVAARVERARAEALLTGKVSLDENNLRAVIDYGRDPALSVALPAAAKRWTAETATPIEDLIRFRALVKDKSKGSLPTVLVLTNKIMNHLQTNREIIGFALNRTNDLPGRVSTEDVITVIAGFARLTRVVIADDAYASYNFGTLGGSVFPDNKILLLPPPGAVLVEGGGSLGTTDYGVTAESINPDYGIPQAEQSGIFGGAFSHPDPEGIDVLVSAVALPLVQGANATLAADVIAEA
ncbi:MAG: major capsid protein [Propionibacteriaceae bacterium]|nr:major capsid protein [Propionibacteriaceae bacterium]